MQNELNFQEENLKGVKCLVFDWQAYRLFIAPSAGGRILGFSYEGVELLYSSEELLKEKIDLIIKNEEEIEDLRKRIGMKLLGGFKTWLAPQNLWGNAPYVDLDLGDYSWEVETEKKSCKITLISPICRETGIRFFRIINLFSEKPKVEIEMGMENMNDIPVSYGLWEVTQLNGPGKVYISLKEETQEVLNQIQNWELSEHQPQKNISTCDRLLMVKCDEENLFKIGIANTNGWLLSVHEANDNLYGLMKTFPIFRGASCAHQASVEIFDSDKLPYYETEIHSPVVNLQPGDSYTLLQQWEACKFQNEEEIASYYDRINKNK